MKLPPNAEACQLRKDSTGRRYKSFYFHTDRSHERLFPKGSLPTSKDEAYAYIRDTWLPAQRAANAGTGVITVVELFEKWLKVIEGRDEKSNVFLLPRLQAFWGNQLVTAVDVTSLSAFRNWMRTIGNDGKPYAARTINNTINCLRGALGVGIKQRWTPADFIVPPKDAKTPAEDATWFMEPDTVRKLIDLCVSILAGDQRPYDQRTEPQKDWRYALWCLLALETAGRGTAVDFITWDRVDLKRGLIDLQPPNGTPNGKGGFWVKNDRKKNPVVAIEPWLLDVLKQEWAKRGVSPYVLGSSNTTHHSVPAFLKRNGIMAVNASFPGRSQPAGRHDFRATWASTAIMAGRSLIEVAAHLGDRLDTVVTHYTRFIEAYAKANRAARPSLWAAKD